MCDMLTPFHSRARWGEPPLADHLTHEQFDARLDDCRQPGAPVLLLSQGGARFEGLEDDADEESFEAAGCFSFAFAFAAFALEVGACARVVARLRDRDPVERGVELPVAATVEPVSLSAARARFERCDAAVARELRVCRSGK
jgi:hypothetical protein